jgi:hypothetical protein
MRQSDRGHPLAPQRHRRESRPGRGFARIGLLVGPGSYQHNAAWAGALLVPFGVLAQAGPSARKWPLCGASLHAGS